MDHPVHLTVSQEETKAWRASVKQRQEDKDKEKEMEAIKYAAPPAQRWTEEVSRLGTTLEQTPGASAGQPRKTFLKSGNRTGTIWSPGGGSVTTAIGLTKMMTLPKKSSVPTRQFTRMECDQKMFRPGRHYNTEN